MSAALRQAVLTGITAEEFLLWPDDEFGRRQQLIDGEIVTMPPASEIHGRLQMEIGALLREWLRHTRPQCGVVAAPGVSPRLQARYNVRVPDLVVTCTPADPARHLVAEPVLIVEILSPSNERETRQNVWAFATIPSVQEIVLVHSLRVEVELFRRAHDLSWPEFPERLGAEASARFDSVAASFRVAEFYATTPLAPPASDRA